VSRSYPALPVEVTLSRSGHRARLSADIFRRSGLVLAVDGVAQSHVNPDDPTDLAFDYIQRMANVVDLMRKPGESIHAIHLGAGALTLPRYIDHTRPGSTQTVFEWETDLVDLVRTHIPWNEDAISTVVGDARESLAQQRGRLQADLLVVDLFSGNHTPSHLTTIEFYRALLKILAPDAIVVLNIVDGGRQEFARGQCRTLAEHFGFIGASGEAKVVKGELFGNLVVVAQRAEETPHWWDELSQRGPHPTATIAAGSMDSFVRDASIQTDEDALPSPQLSRSYSS
jgi:spermidine synthase